MTFFYKKHLLLFTLVFAAFISGCKKDNNDVKPVGERFQVLDSKSSVNGNLVDGIALTATNTFTLAYLNAPAGTSAKISAEAVNGLSIDETTVPLNGSATVNVPMKGTPATDGTFTLSVKIDIGGTVYLCSKVFNVDLPNITAITTTLPVNKVFDVNVVTNINFEIYPKSTMFTIVPPANLTVEIISVSPKGRTLRLTPNSQFIAGDVVITSTFMALPPLVQTIKVTAFSKGDGSTAAPYEIGDAERLTRIQYGLSNAYLLTANITQTTTGTSGVTFAGVLDGNGKKISGCVINLPTVDNVGYFGEIASGAVVKNLTFEGVNFTGQDNTGGVAGTNRGTITGVTLSGTVTGRTYVGGVTGNNYGTITSCDISNLNVTGTNNIASLAAVTNTGSAQASNVTLVVPGTFPATVYGISSATNVDFSFAPSDGTIVVKSTPTGLTATPIANQKVTLTPAGGFISGDLQLSLQKDRLSSLRTVKIFSKTQGSIFDAGDGSVGSPYLISTASALDAVRNDVTKNYKIVNDITLTSNWTPIPTFSGSIDGQGFRVNGVVISTATANDGWINTNTGTIKNIRFVNVNCTTSAAFGIVAGKNTGGTIQNVTVSGSVTSTNAADVLGGIAGELSAGGKITQCYTNITMIASCGMVGGIVGRLTTATGNTTEISFCTSAGSIEINASKNRIAGILGRAEGTALTGIVKNCASGMNIISTGANSVNVNGVGGIFGADQNAGIVPIDQCMFTGTISCGFSIGGIAGVGSSITNCLVVGLGPGSSTPTLRSTGTPATGNIGGIAGTNKVKLLSCVVKNATLKAAATTAAMPVAGITCTYQNGGYTANSFVVNTSLEGSTAAPNGDYVFRISGTAGNAPGVNANNYAGANVTAALRTTAFTNDATGLDGLLNTSTAQSFFQTTIGLDFGIWKLGTDGYPALINVGYNGSLPTP